MPEILNLDLRHKIHSGMISPVRFHYRNNAVLKLYVDFSFNGLNSLGYFLFTSNNINIYLDLSHSNLRNFLDRFRVNFSNSVVSCNQLSGHLIPFIFLSTRTLPASQQIQITALWPCKCNFIIYSNYEFTTSTNLRHVI